MKPGRQTVPRDELTAYLDDLLRLPEGAEDASNNGIQVEGGPEVASVCFGVDACTALFEAARNRNADYVIVHHGLSWGSGFRRITGLLAQRIRVLMQNDMSLYASHLPLDAHPEIGNNAVLARALEIEDKAPFFDYHGMCIGWSGRLPHPLRTADLRAALEELLEGPVSVFGPEQRRIECVGIVSGRAGDAVEDAAKAGLDALITGEIQHEHIHLIRESGVTVFEGGHYRTECLGLRALMQRIAVRFGIECTFVDLPTGR